MKEVEELGAVRVVGGALVRRDVPLAVRADLAGQVQVFGFVELADFLAVGRGSIVEVVAPLFVRTSARAVAVPGVELFVRVDGGEWEPWGFAGSNAAGRGRWLEVGLSTRFVQGAGHLLSLSGNSARLPLVPGGAGLVEWGCKLGAGVVEVEALPVLVKVWP